MSQYSAPFLCGGQRIGEASHPGPFTITTSNPGGLRTKEELLLTLGTGIHQLSETHLSSVTAPRATARIKALGAQQSQCLRTLHGFPSELRTSSTWAGTWTGVASVSSFPCQKLDAPIPPEIWTSSRILLTQHFVAGQTINIANLYGYPRGPTWPRARMLTAEIMRFLSLHYVVGNTGLAAITGDFNCDPNDIAEMAVWKTHGWKEVQELASTRWSQPPVPTCQHSTYRDQIWLSPQLADLCCGVEVRDVFVGHSTVLASFDLEILENHYFTWPRPTAIQWHKIDVSEWQQQTPPPDIATSTDMTLAFAQFSQQWEDSLDGFFKDDLHQGLPRAQRGRGQRTTPLKQTPSTPSCRASRSGEVALHYSLTGRPVLLWYRQLRRIQSYVHSVRSSNHSANAEIYRIQLWRSILKARGFTPSFRTWWFQHEFASSISDLPSTPPGREQAAWIFEVFHYIFREFERWNFEQKCSLLQERHEHSLKLLYRDLRTAPRAPIDMLWEEREFTPLAFCLEEKMVHLDGDVQPADSSSWTLDGQSCSAQIQGPDLIQISPIEEVHIDSVITQRTVYATVPEIHQQLGDFWQKRWIAQTPPSVSDWQRIVAFVQAFMPSGIFHFPPISCSQWRRAVCRFRPAAARGADGYGKLGLAHMPDVYVEALLQMIHTLETTTVAWPAQMLESFVIALSKVDHPSTPNHYRPVILLSMIYRCWAGIRSRQILAQLQHWISEEAFGFLPQREAPQIWLVLQGYIEHCLQTATPLCGISTDVVKAFNCIHRNHVFHLAAHVGITPRVLGPWQRFLSSFTRRFMVHNQLSSAYGSDIGFPEGCPLSVSAMALLDWSLHVYQGHFAPKARTLSFVDNITMYGSAAEIVTLAFFSLRSFLTLWGLQLDMEKSYCWGLRPELRKALQPLGIQVVQDAPELGGSMTFSSQIRNRFQLHRSQSLDDKWGALRRSAAALSLKLVSLPTVFWSKALHGANGCLFAPGHLHKLRIQAMKALHLAKAGANAALRLSLATPATADPGFYLLLHTVMDFRRLCAKSPELLHHWTLFMHGFDGRLFSGPFSRLLSLLSQVGWSVVNPPVCLDQDGLEVHLLQIDRQALTTLLLDAWLTHVSSTVRHRQGMSDLWGIDLGLTQLDKQTMTPLELARTHALQCGTFVSTWSQSKFDNGKKAICSQCLVPDTCEHWLVCPKYGALRLEHPEIEMFPRRWPRCMVQHLLVPKSPWHLSWKRYFLSLPTDTTFEALPREDVHHLFVDGSCISLGALGRSIASWAVVDATTGLVLTSAFLQGITQSIGRAELSACIAAIQWSATHDRRIHLWCDSQYAVHLIQRIQAHEHGAWDLGENHDLLGQLAFWLQQCDAEQVTVHWNPSHLDVAKCSQPWEEWVAMWNDVVDRQAVQMNLSRPPHFWALLEASEAWIIERRDALRILRRFYHAVAEQRHDQPEPLDEVIQIPDEDWNARVHDTPFHCALPLNWQTLIGVGTPKLPTAFLVLLSSCTERLETEGQDFIACSFIELALLLLQDGNFQLPSCTGGGDIQALFAPTGFYTRPTLARVVTLVRRAFRFWADRFDVGEFLVGGLNKSHQLIFHPTDGVLLRLSTETVSFVRKLIVDFTSGRGVRKAADLAKPFL